MPSQAQLSLVRIVVLFGASAFLIASVALPMPAQNAVPPTAVQAAKSPQFASRLAHPTGRPLSPSKPPLARRASHRGPGGQNDLYDNGPINGNVDAWEINFGYVVSDTITVNGGVTGMSFGAWLFPGDTLTSAELSITSEPNSGTSYFDQIVNFTEQGCTGVNPYGFMVCTETTSFNGPTLNAGTYWVNLQNASVPSGDPTGWDENSGVGCGSPGCPSQAEENTVGSIPSESFTMLGFSNGPVCFGSEGNLQIIANFTQQQGGPYGQDGVVMDRAGNLYGAFPNGGNNSAGFAFKLARFASWLLDPLFNFFGGNTGGEPNNLIIGPNGSLYGGAAGGIQNCGSDGSEYCGVVYNLTPQPTACLTSLCSWSENVPYRFTSENDGSGAINVSAYDQEGNLYGTTTTGGTFDAGTVFELTPSGGGWAKTTLYSFTGGNNANPTQVLLGNDGNLYGVAGVRYGNGIVFQLTPSGGGWAETVLHTFGGETAPGYLVSDSAGNLYGILTGFMHVNVIFTLQKTGSGWTYSEYDVSNGNDSGYLNNLTIDSTGKLYGTGSGGPTLSGGHRTRSPGAGPGFAYIFEASYDGAGWSFEQPYYVQNVNFSAGGRLAVDTSGNLYGTTSSCGTYGYGTVWQFSP